ncbi:LacI family DNA-binding transcriptional regulator [Streptomyces griseiscabiei]|uniref:LacI family DNA-binding transcriptional regulator n=2 Tax=Streptomyces griseiscabiei TaxID=2993540 RepID=A0ABU4LHE9_9ACTN|nr:LacI family DNA-binding transcriptional regulator [Streptomyces griseiscabiei]MDX2914604.1 LacI family DNA-binding transcriptional regulator [Streptomyces griseiscabiei]
MEHGPAAPLPRRGKRVSGKRQATLHDVARVAGVSQATASRVLNGSTRTVRQENAARVFAAAAELDYTPHLSAQAIARGSTNTTALVVSGVDDPYFSAIAGGVTQVAEAAGLIVTMAVADRSPEQELQIVRTLRGMRPRAIVLAGSRIDDANARDALLDELGAYREAGGSVVLIGRHDLPFRTVSVDNYGGARQLARALVGLGYRRFAMVRASHGLRTSRDRCTGFVEGLREFGIDVDEGFVVEAEFSRRGGGEAARELVERGLDGTELVFAVNDVMAIGVMTALRDTGVVPGQDIAIAGFDDIGSAVDVDPALTTVSVPLQQVGVCAMELALNIDASRIVPVSTNVVLRGSTPRL